MLNATKTALGSEDIVCCTTWDSKCKFGVVTKAFDDASSSSEDESHSDNDDNEEDKVKKGYAKVAWFNVTFGGGDSQTILRAHSAGDVVDEKIVPESKLKLVDRALMPGDAVRRLSPSSSSSPPVISSSLPATCQSHHANTKSSQRGFVKSVNIVFDVAMLCNKNARLYNIPSNRFFSPCKYSVGCFCVYNFYLGEIESVENVIRFELRTGFVYEAKESVLKKHSVDLHDPTEKYSYFHKTFFYPGQHIQLNSKVLQKSTCVMASTNYNREQYQGLKMKKYERAKVVNVITNSITVQWILRCFSNESGGAEDKMNDIDEVPPSTLDETQLTHLLLMDKFSSLSYSLGDNVLLSLTEKDISEIKNVNKKLFCGADIKDHVVDMETKQLRRNKRTARNTNNNRLRYANGGTHRQKRNFCGRIHHTASIIADSDRNISQKIPLRGTIDDVLMTLNQVLHLSGVEPDESMKNVAAKIQSLATELVKRSDYAETLVEILHTLQERDQLRELALLRFLLNLLIYGQQKVKDVEVDDDESNGGLINTPGLDSEVTGLDAKNELQENQNEKCEIFQNVLIAPSNIRNSVNHHRNRHLDNADVVHEQALSFSVTEVTSDSRVDQTQKRDDFSSFMIRNRRENDANARSCDISVGRFETAYTGQSSQLNEDGSIPNRLGVGPNSGSRGGGMVSRNEELINSFVSTVDLGNSLNVMLQCWSDVIKRRDSNWTVASSEKEWGEGASLTTETETETVSTFDDIHNDDEVGGFEDISDCDDGVQQRQRSTTNLNHPSKDVNAVNSNQSNESSVDVGGIAGKFVPPRNILSLKVAEKVAFKIIMIRTVVNILWQDGTLEKNVPSTTVETLHPHHLDENEYFPGDFVLDTRKESSDVEKYGVVKTVNFAERTCMVRWFSDASDDRGSFLCEEEVSVYDISDLEYFDMNILDMVAKVSDEGGEKSVDGKSLDKMTKTGTAGVVLDIQIETGLIHVLWMEGYESFIPHHCLIGITEQDLISASSSQFDSQTDSEMNDGEDNNVDLDAEIAEAIANGCQMKFFSESTADHTTDDNSWTTESENEVDESSNETQDYDDHSSGVTGTCSESDDRNQRDETLTEEAEVAPSEENFAQQKIKLKKDNFEVVDPSESAQNLSTHVSTAKKYVAHLSEQFASFEVLPEATLHRFMHLTDMPRSKLFHSTLKKELKSLQTALPDGIMVRTFEDRYDLFSCLIVGAEDTPYEQGLFLFDIKLPSNYPLEPPKVAYISYANGKLNPNLYEDGNVCLSLLGTWSGKGTEVWSKDTSSMLQILVSLQGLILNKTPYFNEAGYEKQRTLQTGQENAKMYNEMVIIRLVEMCTAEISNPYETFKNEIIHHFKFVAWSLINRLQLWCDTADSSSIPSPGFPIFPLSAGFRISLGRELKKFTSAVYKMYEMLANYDEGVTEANHQTARVSGTSPVAHNLVEESSSHMANNSSLTLDKLEVNYLAQNIEPLLEDPEKMNVAASDVMAIETTLKTPDMLKTTSQMSEKSVVAMVSTNQMDYHDNYNKSSSLPSYAPPETGSTPSPSEIVATPKQSTSKARTRVRNANSQNMKQDVLVVSKQKEGNLVEETDNVTMDNKVGQENGSVRKNKTSETTSGSDVVEVSGSKSFSEERSSHGATNSGVLVDENERNDENIDNQLEKD